MAEYATADECLRMGIYWKLEALERQKHIEQLEKNIDKYKDLKYLIVFSAGMALMFGAAKSYSYVK